VKNSIIKLNEQEMSQIGGGVYRGSYSDNAATFFVGFLVGLTLNEVTNANVNSKDFWTKMIGIAKEASFYAMLTTGAIAAVRLVKK